MSYKQWPLTSNYGIIWMDLGGHHEKKLNMSRSYILHQNRKDFTSMASINLLADWMTFLEAMEVMLMIKYFYRDKFVIYSKYFEIRHYILYNLICYKCVIFWLFWPGQKCHSKVMHRKEVTHSNGSYERKSRGRKLADEMGRGKKFPWYTHRLMHPKRVTCELHDSYFHLMTIKHAISKIEWAIKWAWNCYITQLSSGSSSVACWVAVELETR